MRLREHCKLANRSLAKINECYCALRQEQQSAQVKSSHELWSRDNIPEARQVNKLSPKSELMIYLGRQAGMKADVFMHSPNTLFYSDKALFNETLFPKCKTGDNKGKSWGTTQLNEFPSNQPLYDEDTTPGDLDNTLPLKSKGSGAPPPTQEVWITI